MDKKALAIMTVWPSGLRRWLKAPFRKGVGSNPTAVKELSVSRGKLCENLKVRSGACDGARALQGVLGGTKYPRVNCFVTKFHKCILSWDSFAARFMRICIP